MSWNDEGRISCKFSFKCPQRWDRLQPTSLEGVRHCPECDRDVHLAMTEEAFRRLVDEGHCVVVLIFTPSKSDHAKLLTFVGLPSPRYGIHLKKI